MFFLNLLTTVDAHVWNLHVRDSFEKKTGQYLYIKRYCSWIERVQALASSVFFMLGALFSRQFYQASKELFFKALTGYVVDLTLFGSNLFSHDDFKRSVERQIENNQVGVFFSKNEAFSLELMALLGAGLDQNYPLLSAYLNSKRTSPGERLQKFLSLAQIISFQGSTPVVSPDKVESYLKVFEQTKASLSQNKWTLRSFDKSGKVLDTLSSDEFNSKKDTGDQIKLYRQIIYMQGQLELDLKFEKPKPGSATQLSLPSIFKQIPIKKLIINEASTWPNGVGYLFDLEELKLVDCCFENIGESLSDCQIKKIDVKGHQTGSIPKEISQHASLIELKVQGRLKQLFGIGPLVETLTVHTNIPGMQMPDLSSQGSIISLGWPAVLRDELDTTKLPLSCRIDFI